LSGLLWPRALGPDDSDRRDSSAQALSELCLHEVSRCPGERLLGTSKRPRQVARRVRVDVDEPRQQHPAVEVKRLRPAGAARSRARDRADDTVLDEDCGTIADLRPCAIEKTCVRQPEAAPRAWGVRQESRVPMRHL